MGDSLLDYFKEDARKACRRAASLEAKIEELANRDPRAMRMLNYIRLEKRADEDADFALRALAKHVLGTDSATKVGGT